MNTKEGIQQILALYKNEALKKLAWHLDREVWAVVAKGDATTSWGRQQTMIEINKYTTSEVNRVMGELAAFMTKYRDELWAETDAGFAMAGNAVNHCVRKAKSFISGDTAGDKGVCECTGVIHVSTDDFNVTRCLSCNRKVD